VLRECTAEIHELVARNSWPRFERSGEPYESVRTLFLSEAADAEPEAEAEAEVGVSFAEMVAGAEADAAAEAADADADAPKRPSRKSIDALCAPHVTRCIGPADARKYQPHLPTLSHLHRDWGPPLPHLHRDCAHRCHIWLHLDWGSPADAPRSFCKQRPNRRDRTAKSAGPRHRACQGLRQCGTESRAF
jgi:hypothetical protein